MSRLIMYGNTNQYTFANSIIAANQKSFEIFGEYIKKVFVIHSQESDEKLSQFNDWKNYIERNRISREILINHVIDLDLEQNPDSISNFVEFIQIAIPNSTDENYKLIVDLSNGKTFQKILLSIVAYLLGIKNQFMIDIGKLLKLYQNQLSGNQLQFVEPEILMNCYISVPDITELDKLAYLGLMEVARYKNIIEEQTQNFGKIDTVYADREYFKEILRHSVDLKFRGDQKKDNVLYRISVTSLSACIEELITLIIEKNNLFPDNPNANKATLGTKIQRIQKVVKRTVDNKQNSLDIDFDFEFFEKFNDFMHYLRNKTVHKNYRISDLERFKANLSLKMSFAFIEFYTHIVEPILSQESPSKSSLKLRQIHNDYVGSETVLYYGLDGDCTGDSFEYLFENSDSESKIKQLSEFITRATKEIGEFIESHNGEIIFKAGDDLLFKGNFDRSKLSQMQNKYQKLTGLTCSIGYGKSLKEAYIALKRAKNLKRSENCSNDNSIVGIEIQ